MFKKDKYDIMKQETKGAGLFAMQLVVKLIRLSALERNGKMESEQYQIEIISILDKLLPIVKKSGHICYETAKDIETIDMDKLLEYLEKKGIDHTKFLINYANTKRKMAQVLLMFAIFDKNNIQIPISENPEIALNLLKGENLKDIIDYLDNISEDMLSRLCEIFDDSFELKNLSEDELKLLEDYHNNYMFSQIYPKVTKKITDEKILEKAKAFSKIRLKG